MRWPYLTQVDEISFWVAFATRCKGSIFRCKLGVYISLYLAFNGQLCHTGDSFGWVFRGAGSRYHTRVFLLGTDLGYSLNSNVANSMSSTNAPAGKPKCGALERLWTFTVQERREYDLHPPMQNNSPYLVASRTLRRAAPGAPVSTSLHWCLPWTLK